MSLFKELVKIHVVYYLGNFFLTMLLFSNFQFHFQFLKFCFSYYWLMIRICNIKIRLCLINSLHFHCNLLPVSLVFLLFYFNLETTSDMLSCKYNFSADFLQNDHIIDQFHNADCLIAFRLFFRGLLKFAELALH